MNPYKEAKVVVVGDVEVGKTALTVRYTKGQFLNQTTATIGAHFFTKTITFEDMKKDVNLKIWDTAGQERFKQIGSLYFQNCDAAILVYDVTNPDSFRNLDDWLIEIRKCNPDNNYFLFVVAAKSDLEKLVSDEEAKEYCKTVHAEFFSTSAKENIGTPSHLSAHPVGVNELFGSVAKHMIHSKGVDNFTTNGNNQYPYVSSTVMNANEPETKKCCCEVL